MAGSKSSETTIAFTDLAAQQQRIRPQLEAAIERVLNHGQYIMGPEIQDLEAKLSSYCGAKHAITCSSGTDALLISLMACGIGPGDAVICPAFTFTATPEPIALLSATAVFVDVRDDTFNIDPDKLDDAVKSAIKHNLNLRAIMPVDLFGRPADYNSILPFAEKHNLIVLCDAAQSFGASTDNKKVGTFGHLTATSFFPAKPLGCYGDGGAVFTDDDTIAEKIKSLRLHGKGSEKYDIIRVGINGRLDTIQAAILLEKLKIFEDELERRHTIAERYTNSLGGRVKTPNLPQDTRSAWAQYTLRIPPQQRDDVIHRLKDKGIPTGIYYPRPLHRQPAYAQHIMPTSGLPVAERLCDEAVSLPMHPYLQPDQQEHITRSLLEILQPV